jgi:hypothetical protein
MPKQKRPGSDKEIWSSEFVLTEGTPAHKAAMAAQEAAIAEKWPKNRPANLRLAIKDPEAPSTTRASGGASRRGAIYENTDGKGKRWYLKASSQFEFPVWIGKDKLVPKVEDLYSGGVWLALVKFAPYQSPATGAGVTSYLSAMWRTSAGTPIGGASFSEDDLLGDDIKFDEVDDDELLG